MSQESLSPEFFYNYVAPLKHVESIMQTGNAVAHVVDQSEREMLAFKITGLSSVSQRNALKFWFQHFYGHDPETVVFEKKA